MSRRRKTTRQLLDWVNPVTGKPVRLSITHGRDYLVEGNDHLEVRVEAPRGASLPITETGYLSHFIDARELAAAGGARRFVLAWLDREAAAKPWRAKELARTQGDLFQWGEANAAVTGRAAPKTRNPTRERLIRPKRAPRKTRAPH